MGIGIGLWSHHYGFRAMGFGVVGWLDYYVNITTSGIVEVIPIP